MTTTTTAKASSSLLGADVEDLRTALEGGSCYDFPARHESDNVHAAEPGGSRLLARAMTTAGGRPQRRHRSSRSPPVPLVKDSSSSPSPSPLHADASANAHSPSSSSSRRILLFRVGSIVRLGSADADGSSPQREDEAEQMEKVELKEWIEKGDRSSFPREEQGEPNSYIANAEDEEDKDEGGLEPVVSDDDDNSGLLVGFGGESSSLNNVLSQDDLAGERDRRGGMRRLSPRHQKQCRSRTGTTGDNSFLAEVWNAGRNNSSSEEDVFRPKHPMPLNPRPKDCDNDDERRGKNEEEPWHPGPLQTASSSSPRNKGRHRRAHTVTGGMLSKVFNNSLSDRDLLTGTINKGEDYSRDVHPLLRPSCSRGRSEDSGTISTPKPAVSFVQGLFINKSLPDSYKKDRQGRDRDESSTAEIQDQHDRPQRGGGHSHRRGSSLSVVDMLGINKQDEEDRCGIDYDCVGAVDKAAPGEWRCNAKKGGRHRRGDSLLGMSFRGEADGTPLINYGDYCDGNDGPRPDFLPRRRRSSRSGPIVTDDGPVVVYSAVIPEEKQEMGIENTGRRETPDRSRLSAPCLGDRMLSSELGAAERPNGRRSSAAPEFCSDATFFDSGTFTVVDGLITLVEEEEDSRRGGRPRRSSRPASLIPSCHSREEDGDGTIKDLRRGHRRHSSLGGRVPGGVGSLVAGVFDQRRCSNMPREQKMTL